MGSAVAPSEAGTVPEGPFLTPSESWVSQWGRKGFYIVIH